MTSSDETDSVVDPSIYTQAYSDFGRLGARLPDKAVEALAREVLVRLAKKLRKRIVAPAYIEELTTALIGRNPKAAADIVEEYNRQGIDANRIYLEFLAPAAKMMGERWNRDEISFAEVTVGTGRVYAIMRNLSRRFPPSLALQKKHALFASIPGETHTLGIKMATDLCRKVGWEIDLLVDTDHDRLVDQIVNSRHHLIGLSGGGVHVLPQLARLVMAIHVSAPSTRILVSGNIVIAAQDSIRLMNVDAMSIDFQSALADMERLWKLLCASEAQL